MSHESWVMSQWVNESGLKKKFCRNNKIMRYVYLFCLVVLLLPAQGTEMLAFQMFVSSSQALSRSTRYGGLNVVTATEESLE